MNKTNDMKKYVNLCVASGLIAMGLVACSNGNDDMAVYRGGKPMPRAVCTSAANWLTLDYGQTEAEVIARLGQTSIVSLLPSSSTGGGEAKVYTYENCRGFLLPVKDAATRAIVSYSVYTFGGSVVIDPIRGVTAITSPPSLSTDKEYTCELDWYNMPKNGTLAACRLSNNPF